MNRIFLLGGKDLEMIVIRDLLKKQDQIFYDKRLSWENAMLSRYLHEIQKYNSEEWTIYGIELSEDVVAPSNYIRIDHHTDFSYKASSLEQVAEVLNYTLNRYENLVAANDRGYMNEMLARGATIEDINQIRLQDRICQGVTKIDEEIALSDIEKNMTQIGDLIIVKTSLQKFSPIIDRLFPFKNLLVYSEREIVYYGINKSAVLEMLAPDTKTNRIYYGGGDDGFVGMFCDVFSYEQILVLVNKIKCLIV